MDEQAKQIVGKIDVNMDPIDELLGVYVARTFCTPRHEDICALLSGADAGESFEIRDLDLIGTWALNALLDDRLSPRYELAELSTFGSKKYSKHPLSPHSWMTLAPAVFTSPIIRHHGQACRGETHVEIIDAGCTSCKPEYIGLSYTGRHETAVLWSVIRVRALLIGSVSVQPAEERDSAQIKA